MKPGFRILIVCVVCGFSSFCVAKGRTAEGPAVVGYVFSRGAALNPEQIDAHSMTRVNYAFAITQDGRLVTGSAVDAQNLALLATLRKENPSLTILVSVGGWLGSGGFSDIALTEQSRKVFADSAIDFLRRYDLDGLDLDWEYPGLPGAGHAYRNEDKQNFTLLLKDLRERFTEEEKTSRKRLYLTIAAGASDEYLAHTELAKVQLYVDAVNLMAYDYNEGDSHGLTDHNAPLFTDPKAPNGESADTSVRAFQSAGVPGRKLILGVPFYGRVWEQVGSDNHGLFEPGKPATRNFVSYSVITGSMLGHGFTRYWDAAASAPYLYSAEQKIFVTYDDPESLAAKCTYVMTHGLGGVMFWQYSDDPSGALLQTIARTLHQSTPSSR
jgi:chitinase